MPGNTTMGLPALLRLAALALLTIGGVAPPALMAQTPAAPTHAAVTPRQPVTVWFNAVMGNNLKAMEIAVQDFQKEQDGYQVEVTLVPEGAYTDRIMAAGKTGDLP
jgi:ABC-type glycerol-3-phosphate transport system substrate-binding protein